MKGCLSIFLFLSIFFLHSYSANAQNHGWVDLGPGLCQVATPCDQEGWTDFSDISCTSDDECWVTSSCTNEIYHTTDGGQTWEVQHTQYPTNAIDMRDSLNGYAGGENGRIYRTTDGGATWTPIGSMGQTLTDIECPPSGDTCYACGDNGNIWSITGTTVTKMNSGVVSHLHGLSFPVNSDEGWVVGGNIILHYTGGAWVGDQYSPNGGYDAIEMTDALNGWAVGDSGIIIHTTDGANWSEAANPDPEARALYDVFFLNQNEGWAVGYRGIILHSTDGGANWQVETEGLTANYRRLNGVFFTSSTNGYVVGYTQCIEGGPPDQHTLLVNKAGTGSGTVTSEDGGIDCGGDCSQPYEENTQVVLNAVATNGSVFSGWSGDCAGCGASSTCQVQMDGDKACTATFDQQAAGDSDGDGVDDQVEDNAPNNGDGNHNGVPDRNEPGVASLLTATGQGYMTVQVTGCSSIVRVTALREGGNPPPADPEYGYPYGLVSFDIPCPSATVTIRYHDATDLSGMAYRKYGPTPPGFGTPVWYTLPGAEFGIDNISPYVRFSLTDSGLGDDIPGDGRITDQGGPGQEVIIPVPVLDSWGKGILFMILALAVCIRQRCSRSIM